jgi:hypothetical protein
MKDKLGLEVELRTSLGIFLRISTLNRLIENMEDKKLNEELRGEFLKTFEHMKS